MRVFTWYYLPLTFNITIFPALTLLLARGNDDLQATSRFIAEANHVFSIKQTLSYLLNNDTESFDVRVSMMLNNYNASIFGGAWLQAMYLSLRCNRSPETAKSKEIKAFSRFGSDRLHLNVTGLLHDCFQLLYCFQELRKSYYGYI